MWKKYFNASSLTEVLERISQPGQDIRLVAGGTDLLLDLEKLENDVDLVIDLSRIPGLDRISVDEDRNVHIGPLVTHNQCVSSELLRRTALPLVLASYQVGSPQIRNQGTIAGNLITASPANDTISPLMALDASVILKSRKGERKVKLRDFYRGVRRTVLEKDEVLIDIEFPAMTENQKGTYEKYALRRAQAISLVNATVLLTMKDGLISDASITLGAVAPTIIHAVNAEEFLRGKKLNQEVISTASHLAGEDGSPIDDIRSSAEFRRAMITLLVKRGLQNIFDGKTSSQLPLRPVLLWGKEIVQSTPVLQSGKSYTGDELITTRLNHERFSSSNGFRKTLLHWIREEALLTGTKEGCAEGECGACTVFLDGKAVMSCLIAAPRADGAEIVTIEGIGKENSMSRVQRSFVDEGAVQCGYCTPGFIMSAEKLLEENPDPSIDDIKVGISGNLCRCTGYYKIVRAIERAASVHKEDT